MANMFRCVLASGGALVLTVTGDSSFAGQTITCTDGTTTLTQICPSTSPYTVEFKIPNGGTWTISSGTASTSVTIPSSAELHDIPNGSTITPTDNIQIWLHCANIWDKTYTTISQVLADASTLQALISSNNASDYMARSTTWSNNVTADSSAMTYIGANDYCADALLADSTWLEAICNSAYFESVLNIKVPTMTGDTTPSGEVLYSSQTSPGFVGYMAFDGNDSTIWGPGKNSGGSWIADAWVGYDFTHNVTIKKIFILPGLAGITESNGTRVKDYTIDGSNDKSTWTTLMTSRYAQDNANGEYKNITLSNNYRYYRAHVTTNWTSQYESEISTLQFYGRASS